MICSDHDVRRTADVMGPRARRTLAGLVLAVVVSVAAACGGEAPEVPLGPDGQPDPVLSLGREVYGARCSTCHGSEGQGGRGKKLNDGRAPAAYPDPADLMAVVVEGKGSGMPSFGNVLEPAEIEAVARYVLEVLN